MLELARWCCQLKKVSPLRIYLLCTEVVDLCILSNGSIYGIGYVRACMLVLSRLKLLQIILILEEKRKESEINAHLLTSYNTELL